MNNYTKHALKEFRNTGWLNKDGTFNDEMQEAICTHVLKLLDVFADEGHSGSTAPYTISLFKRLAMFEPIGPLTGEDSEWTEVSDGVFQNNRMGSVFKQKDRFNGQAYWLDGKVFWEWATHPDIEDGKPFKSYFTGFDSFTPIEFPWVKPEQSEYVFVPTDKFPNEVL
jgi:hypothetical protein